MNETGAEFEGTVTVRLEYLLLSPCRKLSVTGLKKSEDLNKGTIRNYLFSLRTTPAVPLVRDVALFEDDNQSIRAVAEFRTDAGKKSLT